MLFYVVLVCKCVLPPGDNPTAVNKYYYYYYKNPDLWMSLLRASPWDAPGLHVVGQCDVITPDVELPLTQTQDSTQDIAGVDADSHIHIEPCGFTDKTETQNKREEIQITS